MPIHNHNTISERVNRDECSRDETSASAPMWYPDIETVKRSNIMAAMRNLSFDSYDQLHRWSVRQPVEFWSRVLEILQIRFVRAPHEILANGTTGSEPTWLPGARLNIVESCFQAAPDAAAILCGRENGEISKVTYRELRNEVNRVANGLRRLGIEPGDAVALFIPMNARSVAIYLGSILAGCVVISIADSLSREQVLLRLQIGNAKVVFTSGFVHRGEKEIPLYARAADAGLPVIVADDVAPENPTLHAGDLLWNAFLGSESFDDVVHADATAPINVLFSSGTTGEPKAIPWDHLTPIRSASDGHFHQDIHPGDVVVWPTNFGWMMGPWLTFATLINRGTIALFDGAPWCQTFGRFVQDAAVNILGVVPSLVCRWRQTGCMEILDWSAIRLFSSTGECSNPSDMRYLCQLAGGKPVIEYCGGTELGGGYISSTVVQPNIPSAFSTPVLGSEFVILGDNDLPSTIGEAYLIRPALGMSRRLLSGDHFEIYYQGTPPGPNGELLRRHGDQLELLPNGYFRALGRTDDAINLGGIKVGSAEIERVIIELSDISDVAVIGVPKHDGGPNRLVACVGASAGECPDKELLKKRIQKTISEKLSPLFKLDDVFICAQLPRTASNKLMRRELRKMYEQESSSDVRQ
jgi:acetyl-CoA synthetase